MRAAIVRKFSAPLRIEEMRIPTPGPGQILVKVAACGICHTDLLAASGDSCRGDPPPYAERSI
jgi:propanol-preferring alcohol dehydrogenase